MFEVPVYVAVILLLPSGNEDVDRLAFPFARLTVPRSDGPLLNVTVPTGTVVGDLTTAAGRAFPLA